MELPTMMECEAVVNAGEKELSSLQRFIYHHYPSTRHCGYKEFWTTNLAAAIDEATDKVAKEVIQIQEDLKDSKAQ